MKLKQNITLIFLFAFFSYLLCPAFCAELTWGHVGSSTPHLLATKADVSAGASPSEHSPAGSGCCPTGSADTTQPEDEDHNCCETYLNLLHATESRLLTQTFQTAFPLITSISSLCVTPSISDPFSLFEYSQHPRYDYFPSCHHPTRAPPLFLS